MSSSSELFCIACGVVVKEDHIGIRCVQGHDICSDCSIKFVETILEDPLSKIPVKCGECFQEIPTLTFERQLNVFQLEIYHLYSLQSLLDPSEETRRCPHCQYFEIWPKESSANFFYCKSDSCNKVTCSHCYNDLMMPSTENYQNYSRLEEMMLKNLIFEEIERSEEEMYENSLNVKNGINYHFLCGELSELKKEIESAIDEGQKMRCPKCGLAGMKDNACTHMTCPKCRTVWCYLCGLSEVECDKDNGDSIYDHNIDWQCMDSRCPMFLAEINEAVDDSWPLADQECLNKFHDIITKKKLKIKIEKIGLDVFNKVKNHFLSIQNSGIQYDEVLAISSEEPLFKRISREEYEEYKEEWNL